MKPLVGITIGNPTGKTSEFYSLRDDYVRSVEKAGGLPVVLVPGRPEDAGLLLDRLQGLLLTGGADVDPRLYGEPRHPTVTRVFPDATRSRSDSSRRRCAATCHFSLSVGASRC